MGILCEVKLNNVRHTYQPGDDVVGRVTIALDDRVLIKGLGIKINGYASTSWEKPQKPKKAKSQKKSKSKANQDENVELNIVKELPKKIYKSRFDYLSTTNYFMGSEDASASIVSGGRYFYTFCVKLPANCVSSYDSSLGNIRYELQVFIDYADHKHICYSQNLLIRKPYDLRQYPELYEPVNCTHMEDVALMKFWRKPLEMQLNIPQGAYIQGEAISIYVKIINYNNLKLKDIIYKLNMIANHKGYYKKKCETKIIKTNVVTHVHPLRLLSDLELCHLQQLILPPTVPSTRSEECPCIQITYEIEVIATTTHKKRKCFATVPIKIGTVSLNGDRLEVFEPNVIEASPSSSVNNVMPSAPPIETTLSRDFSISTGSLVSSLKESDFMTPTNLNKSKKHTLSGENINFRPKYLYYEQSTGNIPEAIAEENSKEHMASQ